MRLGQHMRVRKYPLGGEIDDSVGSGTNKVACLNSGGTWTGSTCNYAGDQPPSTGDTPTTTTTSDPNSSEAQCPTDQGAVWTGYTCDMSGVAGHQMVSGVDPSQQFSFLSGLTQDPDAMGAYLTSEYGLQDPSRYLKAFEAYDPQKEQKLQESYRFGMGEAQTGARGKLGDIYAAARAGAGKGGFGGRGRKMSQMLGQTMGGLKSQKTKLGKTFESGVTGLREDYVSDWLGAITGLGQQGAQFCTPGVQEWDPDMNDGQGGCKDI